jgi:UDP-2-acetamido-3-amino-2,3-dideoxy-glucuronate N-acetyltransferase
MVNNHFIHPAAIVETDQVGSDTRIWAFVHILKGARIGKNCNICDHCFIENNVVIGDNVTIKSGIYIWDGVTLEDNVFLGPNVVLTNDLRPRSKSYPGQFEKTLIKKYASIGANSTVLCGITIGEYAMAGIGSVITRNVPAYALIYGNPAKQQGWVDEQGNKLSPDGEKFWISENKTRYRETENGLERL